MGHAAAGYGPDLESSIGVGQLDQGNGRGSGTERCVAVLLPVPDVRPGEAPSD